MSILACLHAQSCLTLCDLADYSLPCSFAHGILQARILEWAMPSSRGSSRPRVELSSPVGPVLQEYSLPLSPRGSLMSVFREMLIKRCVRENTDPDLESDMNV